MSRKRKPPAAENHERWLISYADFITLLFAFFVVMFASSQTDKAKAQQMSDSVTKALEGGKASAVLAAVLGGTIDDRGQGNAMMRGPGGVRKTVVVDRQTIELQPSLQFLSTELKAEIDAGRVQVSLKPRGLVVSFNQAALFPSGEDVIDPNAYKSLGKISTALAKLSNPVRLEGHTDSIPIRTPRFRSNWELSAARSIALLEILAGKFNVGRDRLSIAGYADNAPVASNSSPEGRAQNRRVDIVILSRQGIMAEPEKNVDSAEAGTPSVPASN